MVFRHCVGEAVAEVELRRMATPLAISRECSERRCRVPFGDRDGTDPGHPKKIADVLFGLFDARMPLAADARATSKMAIGEVIGECALSSTSASASASGSRVRIATIAEASMNITHHR